jgi:Mrp family chromosome partitioning ATPase
MAAPQVPEQDDFAAEPRSVDLHEYWLVVRRRWVLVLALAVIGAVAGGGYGYAAGPTYTATSQVVVTGVTQGPLAPSTQVSFQVNMSTEQAIAQSAPVIEQAARLLHVNPSRLEETAGKRLTVTVPASTLTTSNVLQIAWSASTPAQAQTGANDFARAYLAYRHSELASEIAGLQVALKSQVASLRRQIGDLATELSSSSLSSSAQKTLTIRLNELTSQASTADTQLATLSTYDDSGGSIINAALPNRPSGLGKSALLAVGGLLGLLIGLALAFARDALDDRLQDPAHLERRLGAATLAILSRSEGEDDGRGRQVLSIATVSKPDSRSADAIRALRATLVAVSSRRSLRTLLVVSADASVSSGHLVSELGVALAESGRRVLLIASDMRGSVIPQIFNLPTGSGLSDLLMRGGDPETLTRSPRQAGGTPLPGAIVRRLAILPTGRQVAHSLSVLDSSSMVSLLEGQRDAYDYVLLDAPPANIADVFALASHVDGVLVLASEGRTRGRAVADVRRRLDQVGALIVGGVLISKGKIGRHRQQPVALGTVAGLPPAGPIGSERPERPERDAGERDRPERSRSVPPVPPATGALPVTRPMPAVPGNTPRTTESAKRSGL